MERGGLFLKELKKMPWRSSVRLMIGDGLWNALKQVREEMRIARAHRNGVRQAVRLPSSGLMVNCGSGPKIKPGWVNVDLDPRAELHLDLRRPLPFRDGSVRAIYSEHFFEHLEYPTETSLFLRESLRVLEPGGSFRVGVPDTEWPVRAYATGDDNYFQLAREKWHPAWCDTRMHNLNYHFRQGSEHKYAWDFETLEKVLLRTGFVAIVRADFDPTLDTELRRIGTLYVEARKQIVLSD
jgi:predicted SAM-dependent methyltransferase